MSEKEQLTQSIKYTNKTQKKKKSRTRQTRIIIKHSTMVKRNF